MTETCPWTFLAVSGRSVALSAAIVMPFPGIASADDCAVIYAAFEALAKVPSYSQSITMADIPAVKAVVIGETIYAHDGSKWTKFALPAGGRAGMLAQFVPGAGSLKDCRMSGTDEVGGEAMTTYTYVPPVPEGMEDFAPKNPEQKLWIGDGDGLPHRMTAEGMEIAFSFEAVTPPL